MINIEVNDFGDNSWLMGDTFMKKGEKCEERNDENVSTILTRVKILEQVILARSSKERSDEDLYLVSFNLSLRFGAPRICT